MGDENKQDPEEQYFLTFFFAGTKKREKGEGEKKKAGLRLLLEPKG